MRKISIHTRQGSLYDGASLVEKSVDGVKHRYVCGIASGTRVDQHGERLTQRCIDSIVRQCKDSDILLYADVHGVKASEDIGILTNFEVDERGDWVVEFRLYDETDKVDAKSLETADKLWKQLNGFPPYTKPRKKGFSIEGYVPDVGGLVDQKEKFGIIDDIVLEGVVVVPEPAYQDSVIHSVYKALGETPEWTVRKGIREQLSDYDDEVTPDVLQATLLDTLRTAEDEVEARAVLQEYTEIMLSEWKKGTLGEPVASPYGIDKEEIIKSLKHEIALWKSYKDKEKKNG